MAKRKKRKDLGLSILAVLLVIVLIIFFSGFFLGYSCANKSKIEENTKVTQNNDINNQESPQMVDPLVEEKISEMSLSDMVYQMMIVSPEEITNVEKATLAGDSTKKAIETKPIGGLIYASKNFEDAAQTESLIKKSQSYSKLPLFIAIAGDGFDKYSEDEFNGFGFNLFLKDEFDDSGIADIEGVIISKYTGSESLVEAIKSGANIICNSTELEDNHAQIMKSVEAGEISEEFIKQSVIKILTLKLSKGILN